MLARNAGSSVLAATLAGWLVMFAALQTIFVDSCLQGRLKNVRITCSSPVKVLVKLSRLKCRIPDRCGGVEGCTKSLVPRTTRRTGRPMAVVGIF